MKASVYSLGCVAAVLMMTATVSAQDDRQMIDEAAADRAQAVTVESIPADASSSEEVRARAALALATAKLELVLARKALKAKQWAKAGEHADRARTALADVPGDDADAARLQAEGIVARAGVSGSQLEPANARVTASSDAREWAYRGGSREINKRGIYARDDQQVFYEGGLREMVRSDELRRLIETDEARIAPRGAIEYPAVWPERAAARAEYEGGQIARSESTVDASGREWFTAVYDISDLTYVPPNFTGAPTFDAYANTLRLANLTALRERSQIFGGYAEDLAAGLPLLHYLGGLDDYSYMGPRHSYERRREIVEMMRAFTGQHGEAMITSQPPVGP